MGIFTALETAGSGMRVFKTWLDATANNVSNMNSISLKPGGEPFKTELVIAEANADSSDPNAHGARVREITHRVEDGAPQYDPLHPYADPVTGEVKYPAVDVGEQMVNMMAAQRGYQANVSMLQQARDSYQAALRLGH
jgi:flagellar basal-body rod protein FlgC